ncbi:hypothetical protein ABZ883_31000 [Streptomyces sp. NPDC046977]|uniref:hypothetical protein n=1 Tax=Streptomyces sp. NPDC046977 TaxID=3154703 RepID=UPI0033CD06B7
MRAGGLPDPWSFYWTGILPMDLPESLGLAVTVLKAPLEHADREQGWTDELRREIQEEISVSRSVLRRLGPWAVTLLRPRLDEWMAHERVRPGRLRDVVMEAQTRIVEARDAARRQTAGSPPEAAGPGAGNGGSP